MNNEYIDKKDKEFTELIKNMYKLLRLSTIISSVYQYKYTRQVAINKTINQENAIIYGINDINSKILTNTKKYKSINDEKDQILEEYKDSIEKKGKSFDDAITRGYIKILDAELSQIELMKKIYKLRKEELVARAKLDNSDDDILEQIYDIEDEISKIDTKNKRLRTTINNKIKEKKKALEDAMESEEKQLQKKVKNPTFFKGVKKFFFGKINPQKLIKNNVFLSVEERIRLFKKQELSNTKKTSKYTEDTLLDLVMEVEEQNLKNGLSN